MNDEGKKHTATIDLAMSANTLAASILSSLRMVWPIQYDEVRSAVDDNLNTFYAAVKEYENELHFLDALEEHEKDGSNAD